MKAQVDGDGLKAQPREVLAVNRRTALVADTLRRLARRGARGRITNLLGKTRPEDVAEVLPTLTPEHQTSVFDILVDDYPEAAGEVLIEAEPSLRLGILQALAPERIAGLLSLQAVDDQVFLVEALPEERRDEVLELVNLAARNKVQTHLTYGDDSAGRIMDSQFYALSEEKTIGEAIASLQESRDLENIFYLYVVDDSGHLTGVTSLRQLLLTPPERHLSQVMARSVIKAHIETDQEEVAELATRYNLLAVPVVDDDNKLVGIVTVDDIIDVVQEEANEDFFKMVGTTDDELVYQDRSFKVAGIRLPWLFVNLVGLLGAALLLTRFETSLGPSVPDALRVRTGDHGHGRQHRQPDVDHRRARSGHRQDLARTRAGAAVRLAAVQGRGHSRRGLRHLRWRRGLLCASQPVPRDRRRRFHVDRHPLRLADGSHHSHRCSSAWASIRRWRPGPSSRPRTTSLGS